MKLAFIIDKPQTFQIVAGQLFESLRRGHICNLFCIFEKDALGGFLTPDISNAISEGRLIWRKFNNKKAAILSLEATANEYDAVLGINFFNSSWTDIYNSSQTKSYSFEYCWNEMYNQTPHFEKKTGSLFCNTNVSKNVIHAVSGFKGVSTGSPWYELLDKHSSVEKNKIITILQPHNSLYGVDSNILPAFIELTKFLQEWCSLNDFELILKSRKKYKSLNSFMYPGKRIWDENAYDHIDLYSKSSLVFHFCSSAINELSFLKTPNIAVAPGVQKRLHPTTIHAPGIKRIHERYYSGDIFDNNHYEQASLKDILDLTTSVGQNRMNEKMLSLIKGKKDWHSFQQKSFPGEHIGSTKRILDIIEG